MKDKNGFKRQKSPYLAWFIMCPIFSIWFFANTIALTLYNDFYKVFFATYSFINGLIWVFLFGFHLANHLNCKRTRKIQQDVLRDFKIIEEQLQKELDEEPFEEFKENKFKIDK